MGAMRPFFLRGDMPTVHEKERALEHDISGKVDHNAFWNPLGITTNDDVKISLGSGASRCDVSVTNNWISEGTYYDCPGTTESQNTTHDPSQQPPSPIRP